MGSPINPQRRFRCSPIQPSPKHTAPRVVPVAITTRVSTLHQAGGRFDSCESQAAICRDYIRKRAHKGYVEFFCRTNPAYFGGSVNRTGLQALRLQIEAGEVKVVFIFKFERMLRNTDEWAPFRSFLARHGCRLVSTTEGLSEETPSGRLKNNMLVSVAEYERLNTAEKVRAKLAELAKRGVGEARNLELRSRALRLGRSAKPVSRKAGQDRAVKPAAWAMSSQPGSPSTIGLKAGIFRAT